MSNFKAVAGQVCSACGHTFAGGENVGVNSVSGEPRHYNERLCKKIKKERLRADAARVTKKLATDPEYRNAFNVYADPRVLALRAQEHYAPLTDEQLRLRLFLAERLLVVLVHKCAALECGAYASAGIGVGGNRMYFCRRHAFANDADAMREASLIEAWIAAGGGT